MGDRAPGSVIVYECPIEAQPAVLDIVKEYMELVEHGESEITGHLELGVRYTCEDVYLGFEGSLGPELEGHDASYEIHGDGLWEYDPCVRMWTPRLGLFAAEADHAGFTVINSPAVDQIINHTKTRDDLVRVLLLRTGKAWDEYFHAIVHGYTPPTLEEMVAARRRLTRVEEDLTDALSES